MFHVIGHKLMAHQPTVQQRPWPGAFYDLQYGTREEAFAACDAIRSSCRLGYNRNTAEHAIQSALSEHYAKMQAGANAALDEAKRLDARKPKERIVYVTKNA